MVTETKGRERKKDSRVWGMQLLHSPHCSQNRTSIFMSYRKDEGNRESREQGDQRQIWQEDICTQRCGTG